MSTESSKKIDEIMIEKNDKKNASEYEKKLIKCTKKDEKEKQIKYAELRKEFEKIMFLDEEKVKKVMKNIA